MAFAAQAGLPCLMTGATGSSNKRIWPRSKPLLVTLSSISRAASDLLTLAALIQHARLLVTVDSAPMHLAAALQTPQVALFGPTNPLHWRPRETPALILQAGQAAPLREFSPEQKPAPMNLISTSQVIDGMKTLLATPRAAPL